MPSVLITGANRGLGLEFARQYEADNWQVFATCRHPESATNLQDLAKAGRLKIIELDVTDEATIKGSSQADPGANRHSDQQCRNCRSP